MVQELSPLQRAVLTIKTLRGRLDELERARREPIAIVGMACRFPGGADSPRSYWELLRDGVDAVGRVPSDRWDADAYYDPTSGPGWTMNVREGGFLRGPIADFDPEFFGISPREAASLDPQQRLLLEVAWEALEHGGIAPDSLVGSDTGVYIGFLNSDYGRVPFNAVPAADLPYVGTGSGLDFPAGRIAYVLGLQGPCMVLGTACSSALTAIHVASQALRAGEAGLAIAGGVNLILHPDNNIILSKMRALAPDGRCRTFDADARGYGRGEGCGVVVLERLADARARGHRVLGLVRGSAVNHDGASGGLTVPNGPAQEKLLRRALAVAGLAPADVDYVEAHGTGTPLGDPIELRALDAVLGEGRDRPLLVGSVKTNLAHLESAAGVASLLKVLLAFEHERIPAHLHLRTPNPALDWSRLRLEVPTRARPWPAGPRPRVAGISGFGLSGINAHVLVEEPPRQDPPPPDASPRPAHLLTLAARDRKALAELAARWAASLRSGELAETSTDPADTADTTSPANTAQPAATTRPADATHFAVTTRPADAAHIADATRLADTTHIADATHPAEVPRSANTTRSRLADACFTANTGRARFAHRLAVVAGTPAGMAERLERFVAGEPPGPGLAHAQAPATPPRLAFLFTGQGSQTPGMGEHLYRSEPAFRAVFDRCDAFLAPRLGASLRALLHPTDRDDAAQARLDRTGLAQPALFALELALAHTWMAWGVRPDYLLGHSVGEYAAACVAGVFNLEDGLLLISERARLMQSLPDGGAMAALSATPAQAHALLTGADDRLAIAAINGPRATVLSGPTAALDDLLARAAAQGLRARKLRVSHAFHSPLMDPILAPFAGVLAQVQLRPPQIPLISNLDGREVGDAITKPAYWLDHLRRPVAFARGITTLAEAGVETFLEIGPQPTLVALARACAPETGRGRWLASLRPGRIDGEQLFETLGELWTAGVDVDLRALDAGRDRRLVAAPTYPFQRRPLWLTLGDAGWDRAGVRPAEGPAPRHLLLGRRHPSPAAAREFTARVGAREPAYLADHRVHGEVVMPGAAWAELALAGATDLLGPAVTIEALRFVEALALGRSHELRTLVTPTSTPGAATVEIFSARADGHWTLHARARAIFKTPPARPPAALADLRAACPREHALAGHYAELVRAGLDYGPWFRGIRGLWSGPAQVLAVLALPDDAPPDDHILHPALLDACFQAVGAAFDADARTGESAWLPVGLERLHVHRPGVRAAWVHARVHATSDVRGAPLQRCDLDLFAADGQPIAEIGGLELRRVARDSLLGPRDESIDGWLYKIEWRPKPLPPTPRTPGRCLIVGAPDPLAASLAATLRARGWWTALAGPSLPDDLAELALATGPTHLVDLRGATTDILAPNTARPDAATNILAPHDGDARPDAATNILAPPDPPGEARDVATNIADSATDVPATALRLATQAQGLLKTLVDRPRPQPLALWLVTRGAQAAAPGDALPGLAAAPLVGLGKAIARELPELGCRRVDLDAQPDPRDADRLADELLAAGDEDELALRGDLRLVPRLVRAAPLPPGPPALDPAASYLITGGLGGLGLQCAERLAARGARHLILVGRSAPGPAAQPRLAALAAADIDVRVMQADIADPRAVADLFAALAGAPPLRGIVHTAGIVDDGILPQQTAARFARVFAPKVDGAWNLHRLAPATLDFLSLFGSAAALLGSAGQASYVAANAFLDALAHHRVARGVPAASLDWSGWADHGAASNAQFRQRMERLGVLAIAPDDGLAVFERSLGVRGQLGVLPVDWARLADRGRAPLLAELLARPPAGAPASDAEGALRDELAALPAHARRDVLARRVAALVNRVLGRAPDDPFDPAAGFFEQGMDSLMSVELRNALQRGLATSLPATLAFDNPTLHALVDHLAGDVLRLAPAVTLAPAEPPAPEVPGDLATLLADLDDLDDGEVEALLRKRRG